MEPVRVLHVLHSMNCGGAETLLMHLYRNMDTDKVQFDFLVNVFDEMFYEKESFVFIISYCCWNVCSCRMF